MKANFRDIVPNIRLKTPFIFVLKNLQLKESFTPLQKKISPLRASIFRWIAPLLVGAGAFSLILKNRYTNKINHYLVNTLLPFSPPFYTPATGFTGAERIMSRPDHSVTPSLCDQMCPISGFPLSDSHQNWQVASSIIQ